MQSPQVKRMNILLSKADSARVSILYEAGRFWIEFNNVEVNRHGLRRLPHSIPGDADAIDFHRILHGLVHYEYHLQRSNTNLIQLGKVPLRNTIFLEMFKVPKFERTDKPIPLEGENFNRGEAGIDITFDDSWYAIKIRNKTKLDLYPSLFYFDNCNLSITSLYEPPNRATPPLRAGQSLVIGTGSAGGVPCALVFRESQVIEVGFLKLFLATKYVELSDVEQASPFCLSTRGTARYSLKPPLIWDTIIIPVIVRRPPPLASRFATISHLKSGYRGENRFSFFSSVKRRPE